MPVEMILLLAFITVLVVGWLVMAYKAPPLRRRNSADYRHQQSENPDYSTPSGGGQGGI